MLALADRIIHALPLPIRRRVPLRLVHVAVQFAQFGTVGTIGFLVDTAAVYALRPWVNLYVAGTLAYAAAVTTTWWLNRIWTFRGAGHIGPRFRQLITFVVATLPGLCLNLGSYFLLIAFVPLCATHPVIAIAAGAVAGMFANFAMSRAVVFR